MKSLDEKTLQIEWNDGHVSIYPFQFLRGSCPCAECVDEITSKRIVHPEHVPEHVRPLEARPVGRYAYQFFWSDGHSTGLYTYGYLRAICQCEACQKARQDPKSQNPRQPNPK